MRLRQAFRGVRGVGAGVVIALLVVSSAAPAQTGDGFLFRQPPTNISLRFGFDHALAQSDVFTFVTDQLTLDRGDFGALTIGADVAVRLAPRVDLVFGGSYAGMSARSEFRDWVDQDDLPIEQTTRFKRVPVTLGLRAYLTPRGRAVGSLAWIPASRSFYVGGGVGGMWYRFSQVGDFVDFETLNVFRMQFESEGLAFAVYGSVGAQLSLGTRSFLSGEARYTWAKATLTRGWIGFDRIDLSGLAFTVGVGLRQ